MKIGIVLLIMALSLFIYNMYQANRAYKASQEILKEVIENIGNEETEGSESIGYLMIPKLNLTLPVLTDWSYEKMEVAPCRYSGTIWRDDLVIAAHNYRNHFGRIGELQEGDRLSFVDMAGKKYEYEVKEVEELQATAIEEMIAGEYDMTLFTCTYSGRSRIAVRCDRIKN